jgi:DNA polymerase III delta prime subunit
MAPRKSPRAAQAKVPPMTESLMFPRKSSPAAQADTPHVPGPISENVIFIQLQRTEQMLEQVYEGRLPVLVISAPPGIGKSTLGERVARKYHSPWRPERPGTALGLLEVLRKNQHGGVVPFDDIDGLWDDDVSLNIMKAALDSKERRYISHTVGGSKKNSIKRFELKCGVVFLSNRNFWEGKKEWLERISAVRDRAMIVSLSFDSLALYEYTGWLATKGNMLRDICINLKPGSKVAGKRDGDPPIIIGKNNGHRYLSLDEANDVLELFARHAARFPNIGPRDLYKFARLRIGADKRQWEGWCEEQMFGSPKWKLPPNLHVYRIEKP